jgi:hypothetical protein
MLVMEKPGPFVVLNESCSSIECRYVVDVVRWGMLTKWVARWRAIESERLWRYGL